MKATNENRRGSNNSGASRDGNSYERRDVKSILKGSRANTQSRDKEGDRYQSSTNFRKDEDNKPRFSVRKFERNDDRPNFRERPNSDQKRPHSNSEHKPYVSRDNRSSDESRRPFNSDRKPYAGRDEHRSDENRRPYNSDRKPYTGRDDRRSDENRRPYNSDRKPFGNRDDRQDDRRYNSDKPRFVKKGELSDRPTFRKHYDDNEPREAKLSFRKAGEVVKSEFVETRFDNKNKSNGVTFRKRNADDNYDPNAKYSKKKQIEYQKNTVDPTKPVRLNKFLANAGICSRREADEYIQAGVITVNGEVISELGTKILPTDKVMFHNQPVRSERKIYLLLNKPKDCVTTSEDTHAKLTVLDLVKNACSERIYPVGRLDRNTTGVLLLTNDGDLASKLTHPKYNKKKIYHVSLDRNLEKADFEAIMKGVDLDEFTIAADALEFVKEDSLKEVGIEIHTGQNRVVRRIFEKFGYKILRLDRVYFAGLTKKNVPRGKFRFLTEREVNILKMGAHE
ncbi:MAG: RNA-binding domain protein [Bacteroidetes bacterium]|nr:RNA-binding domain protein [Bacteroidota bacterium]